MQTALLTIKGHWAHFKKPETNNNPLTHDFITKTALIGMMGAVLGIDREQMRSLFPILSQDLLYGVALQQRVWKQSWAFTLRRFDTDKAQLVAGQSAPRAFEILREPCFSVLLALNDTRSEDYFESFVRMVSNEEAHCSPILGLHNCPAEIELSEIGEASLETGSFETYGFVPRNRRPQTDITGSFRMGFERLPTIQNDIMWNPPDRYIEVVYSDVPAYGSRTVIRGEGEHFKVRYQSGREEKWCLI